MTALKLANIRIDGGTQARAELDQSTVADYAEAMEAGAKFPAITVFYDGTDHWLADGFHRFFGAKKVGFLDFEADVRQGTKRDAILFSLGANGHHGLRRSNDDKRKAVETLLADAEWAKWSNREVAKACGVSESLVRSLRENAVTTAPSSARTYTTKHGTTAVMKTDKIGKKEAPKKAVKTEAAPLQLVAPTGDVITEEDLGADDPLDMLEELQRDNESLQKQIAVMTEDDTKAELHKMILQRDHAVRQQSEAMDKAAAAVKREAWSKRQLMRCGKAVGEDDPDKIAASVEAFVRQFKKAA